MRILIADDEAEIEHRSYGACHADAGSVGAESLGEIGVDKYG